MSQDIENQQITSLKYTAITPGYVKMSKNRAFGMLVAENSVNALQVRSIALVLLLITM